MKIFLVNLTKLGVFILVFFFVLSCSSMIQHNGDVFNMKNTEITILNEAMKEVAAFNSRWAGCSDESGSKGGLCKNLADMKSECEFYKKLVEKTQNSSKSDISAYKLLTEDRDMVCGKYKKAKLAKEKSDREEKARVAAEKRRVAEQKRLEAIKAERQRIGLGINEASLAKALAVLKFKKPTARKLNDGQLARTFEHKLSTVALVEVIGDSDPIRYVFLMAPVNSSGVLMAAVVIGIVCNHDCDPESIVNWIGSIKESGKYQFVSGGVRFTASRPSQYLQFWRITAESADIY